MKFLKDFKAGIFFVGVLLVLSAISFWDESKTRKEDQEEKVKDRIVDTGISVKDITEINVLGKNGEKDFNILKEDGTWKLKSSLVNEVADPMVVDGFIEGILEAKYVNKIGDIEDEARLKDYGLDDSNYKLVLGGTSGEGVEFRVGGSTPMDNETYLDRKSVV